MIELRSVSKTYGAGASRIAALSDVSLRIGRGQFVSVMGPSGSGKSTLLNLVSALDTPASGTVMVDGQDIAQLDDDALTLFRRRRIGLIFQFFNLLPTLNALDNTLLPVMLERAPNASDRERAASLLTEVGLAHRKEHRTHELSGGEMQRVAIARALMMKPALVLADEPTGNLDSTTGASILALLRRTCLTTQTTIVMVTHDPIAGQVADRMLLLKDGRVQRDELLPAATSTAAEQPAIAV